MKVKENIKKYFWVMKNTQINIKSKIKIYKTMIL